MSIERGKINCDQKCSPDIPTFFLSLPYLLRWLPSKWSKETSYEVLLGVISTIILSDEILWSNLFSRRSRCHYVGVCSSLMRLFLANGFGDLSIRREIFEERWLPSNMVVFVGFLQLLMVLICISSWGMWCLKRMEEILSSRFLTLMLTTTLWSFFAMIVMRFLVEWALPWSFCSSSG